LQSALPTAFSEHFCPVSEVGLLSAATNTFDVSVFVWLAFEAGLLLVSRSSSIESNRVIGYYPDHYELIYGPVGAGAHNSAHHGHRLVCGSARCDPPGPTPQSSGREGVASGRS
jgi:hypothetical protein